MKLRIGSLAAAWVAFGIGHMMAQDLMVTPFGWLHSESNPDQLPVRAKPESKVVPATLSRLDRPTYARVREVLDEEGSILSQAVVSELPWLEKPIQLAQAFMTRTKSAQLDGKPVLSRVEYFLVFNPAASSPKGVTASPRLIQPVTVLLPGDKPDKAFVDFEFSINARGEASAMKPVSGRLSAGLIERAQETLSRWKFAAARKGGVPTASSIVTPVLFLVEPPTDDSPASSKPVPIHRVPPEYPFSALREGVPGEVLVQATIGVDGVPKAVTVLRASHRIFTPPAVKAVSAWRFRPARSNGAPVEATFLQPITFSIEGQASHPRLLSVRREPEKLVNLPPALQWDEPPEYIVVQPAVYPFEALASKKEGTAQLAFVVGPKGEVAESRVVAASDPAFGGAALAMLDTFKFQPASKLGRPSSALLSLAVDFRLRGNALVQVDSDTLHLVERLKVHRETFVPADDLSHPLVPLNRQRPVFPSSASDAQTAEAIIECVVDRTGEVQLPRVISATSPSIGYAAVQAVGSWRFEPPIKDGKVVDVIARHTVNFKPEE